jgi:S-DNA-T family DNA segregation ATPase FtsK/SpoIIIE
VRVVLAAPGPVITRYEIEPATGVKGSQIVNLAKDLARSLSLVSIRVIETIPGKNFMALELPNAKRQSIKLSEILGSQAYNEGQVAAHHGPGQGHRRQPRGRGPGKMPHVLVAGTTGSGKSVGINAMILSLLYKAEARDVRLLMIDPKMLEMSVYEGIPHLLAPVVTDMRQAANGLTGAWRDGAPLQADVQAGRAQPGRLQPQDRRSQGPGRVHLQPLQPDAGQPEPLERPAPHRGGDRRTRRPDDGGGQEDRGADRPAGAEGARAGIHLILATQRPSVDVITGLIKANIPTRIAFQVSSKIDSRTILDQMGAKRCWAWATCCTWPAAPACRCACTAPS